MTDENRALSQTGGCREDTPELEAGRRQWLTTSDGMRHPALVWGPKTEGRPVVFYMHGIEGHGLWFAQTAQSLAADGITTWAVDRRGAGASPAPRGHIQSWQRLVDDATELVAAVSRAHADYPVMLMANCWGAKVATLIAKQDSPGRRYVKALILTSPAVAVKVDVPLWQKLQIAWRYITGSTAAFPIPLEPSHFTDNPSFLQFIENDPLRLREATARFFVEGLILTRLSAGAAASIKMPVLVTQAGIDRIVELEGMKKWFEQLASEDKTLKIFPEVHHSLDFDRDPREYRKLLSDWILDRWTVRPQT